MVEHRCADASDTNVSLFVIEPIPPFSTLLKVLVKFARIDDRILRKALKPFESEDLIYFLSGETGQQGLTDSGTDVEGNSRSAGGR